MTEREAGVASPNNAAERTTAVVLAGGKGTRLAPLTNKICKPALPFGGSFRCIDFALSNCVNSGVRTIGVATQHEPDALLAHLWSRWNSAAVGDTVVVHAWRAEERAALFGYCGTADAVYRNLASIPRSKDSLVLVLAGDHIYKMDYRPMLEAHCARNAAVTIGCIDVPVGDARHLGVVAVGDDGRIERFVEKPGTLADVPRAAADEVRASMGIYVFDTAFLARILHIDAANPASSHDFSCDILPRLIGGGRAYSYAFREAGGPGAAYWRDIGTLRAYWRAQMDLLGPTPLLTLDDPRWPLGRGVAPPRAIVTAEATASGGTVENSIVSATATVAGQVSRSVVCDEVEIGRGAKVTESVLLPGAMVGAGSRLHGVIVDAGYRVAEGAIVEQCFGVGEPPVLSASFEGLARQAAAR
jgi:glucose-1-phosphate adenylyltransferase